MTMFGSTVTS